MSLSDPHRTLLPRERAEYGALVHFVCPDGARFTIHALGPVGSAVRGACAVALARDPDALVETVCTPDTIYADLQGRTRQHATADRYEAQLLSRLGLLHLASPAVRDGREQWWGT